jgi:hypothetical protein
MSDDETNSQEISPEDKAMSEQVVSEQMAKLAQIANSIILQTANQVGFVVPDLKEIYDRNKLLIGNEDTLTLLKYSSFLHQMLLSHLVTRIIEDIKSNKQSTEIDENNLKVDTNEEKS